MGWYNMEDKNPPALNTGLLSSHCLYFNPVSCSLETRVKAQRQIFLLDFPSLSYPFLGPDTKLMQNSGRTKFKRTSIDRLMNTLVLWVRLPTCGSLSPPSGSPWVAPLFSPCLLPGQ